MVSNLLTLSIILYQHNEKLYRQSHRAVFHRVVQTTYDGGNMDDDYWDSLLGSENLLRNDIPEGPMRDFWDKLIVAYNDLLQSRYERKI